MEAAGKTKVVLSGGVKINDEEFLEIVKNVMASGAMGAAVGRNIWQNDDPLKITEKLQNIVFSK